MGTPLKVMESDMKKCNELANPTSCLNRAADTEWLFVLLGRDWTSPSTVRHWIEQRIQGGKNKREDKQITEAEQWIMTVGEDILRVLNPRRITLAERCVAGNQSVAETEEFQQLQYAVYSILSAMYPRINQVDQLAAVEKRLNGR